jgi:hypothetical protein
MFSAAFAMFVCGWVGARRIGCKKEKKRKRKNEHAHVSKSKSKKERERERERKHIPTQTKNKTHKTTYSCDDRTFLPWPKR